MIIVVVFISISISIFVFVAAATFCLVSRENSRRFARVDGRLGEEKKTPMRKHTIIESSSVNSSNNNTLRFNYIRHIRQFKGGKSESLICNLKMKLSQSNRIRLYNLGARLSHKVCPIFVAIFVILLIANAVSEQQFGRAEALEKNKKCSEEKTRQMDECASKMGFFGDRNFKVPQNQTAAQKFCQQMKESIVCIQNYARDCLTGFSRQLMTSLLKRGKQQQSLICQDAQSRDDFRKKMSCITDDKMDQLHDTIDASIVRYEYIASNKVNPDYRLPGVCCSYQIFNTDIDLTLDRICGKPLTRNKGNTHEFVHKVVGGTAGEFFGLICDGHRSEAECKASSKTSPYFSKLQELTEKVKQGKEKPNHKSLVPVLLEILDGSSA